jgi:ribose/xylose/arabinose/galactoside ABC-type transport system permease subunit
MNNFITNHKYIKKATQQKATIAVIFMLIIMLFFKTNFFTSYNIFDLLNSASILMILAFGITMVITAGGIDLSIGGTLVVAGIVSIQLMDFLPIWLAIIGALLVGAIIGVINGYLVVYQKTEPFIITLGMGMLLTGFAMQLTDAHPIAAKGLDFMMIANGKLFGVIPNLVIIMLVVFVITYWILRHTQFGRNCYAIGGDYEVAEYSGINVRRIKAATYVICGVAAALGGVMLSSKLNSGSAVYGETTALTVISGVVVGGTSLAGGVGGIPMTAMGLLVFGVMENAMNMLGINPYVQTILRGLVIVTILCLDSYGRKRKREAV